MSLIGNRIRSAEESEVSSWPRAWKMERSVLNRFQVVVSASALSFLCAACSLNRQPPPFEIHSAATLSSHHLGTPLSGPSMSGPAAGKESSVSYADALDIRVRWFSLERFDCRDLPLLASKATLVTANLADQAVLPATSLTSNAAHWMVREHDGRASDGQRQSQPIFRNRPRPRGSCRAGRRFPSALSMRAGCAIRRCSARTAVRGTQFVAAARLRRRGGKSANRRRH